jgi:hypothetical protein
MANGPRDQKSRNWLNIITRQAIRRGTFTSLRVLIKTIKSYSENWNRDAKPFT